MLPEPLHPAVVHFPIVLVAILPIVAIVGLVLIRRGESALRVWLPVVVLAAALTGSAFVAVRTGEAEEERVEEIVAESAIHSHEEAAELFLPLSAGVLLLAAAGLLKGRVGKAARPVALVATLGLLVAGYRVGHTGGSLVYEHGAAAAYTSGPVPFELQDDHDESSHREIERSSEGGR